MQELLDVADARGAQRITFVAKMVGRSQHDDRVRWTCLITWRDNTVSAGRGETGETAMTSALRLRRDRAA